MINRNVYIGLCNEALKRRHADYEHYEQNKNKVGMIVHVDTDSQVWGRVCSDGKIKSVIENGYFVKCVALEEMIFVPANDVWTIEDESRIQKIKEYFGE